MDLATLAYQTTNILAPALPTLYVAGKPALDKGKDVLEDLLYNKAYEKLGSKCVDLFNKIRSKKSESLEVALNEVSKNPEDSDSKKKLQQEILILLGDDLNLAKEIEHTIFNIDNVRNLNVAETIIINYIENSSNEAYSSHYKISEKPIPQEPVDKSIIVSTDSNSDDTITWLHVSDTLFFIFGKFN